MPHRLFCALFSLAASAALFGQQVSESAEPKPRPSAQIPAAPLYKLEDGLLEWKLAPQDKAYGAIDGHRIHSYVEDLTAISRKYRDSGHPQFWGRIIGTQADTDTRDWLVDKFNKLGLTDVHVQQFDLPPQWMPQSWEIVASGSGKTLHLDSAQPAYQTKGTSSEGLDLEAVYAGTGSEADFAGRDVSGKAVFIFSMPLPGSWRHTATAEGALRRAEAKGAAAIFAVIALPGNIRTQLYPTGTNVPTFSMGMDDGYAMRDLIGSAPAGQPPRVRVKLDIKMEPGLKTGTVWAKLPGTTDETINVLAHRDGWFESGTDNASGVATMVGLADYFSKIPKEKRRRTIIFVGSTGHHNGGNMSGTWLLDHRDEVFAKSALLINCEHTSTIQTYLLGEDFRPANMYTGMLWYAGGPSRPKLQDIAVNAFRAAGVVTYASPERAAPGGEMSRLWPFTPGVQASDYNVFFHSDHESADTVPWTGLEAITRAYAMIIDGVNTLDLKDVQRPPENVPPARVTR
jgi:Peptidase family M28